MNADEIARLVEENVRLTRENNRLREGADERLVIQEVANYKTRDMTITVRTTEDALERVRLLKNSWPRFKYRIVRRFSVDVIVVGEDDCIG